MVLGLHILPSPGTSFTNMGSLEAECRVTESNGFSLVVLHPLLKITPHFSPLRVWVMNIVQHFVFSVCSFREFLIAFPPCFICHYHLFPFSNSPFFHATSSIAPLPGFHLLLLVCCPLGTLSISVLICTASSARLVAQRPSRAPLHFFPELEPPKKRHLESKLSEKVCILHSH